MQVTQGGGTPTTLEDQLGALGLILNMVVLWNTRYLGIDRLVGTSVRSTG